tara:strand:- start:1121 stop:1336 length:216 start_codon:yes stop_codon:yes gene_type:complete
MANNLTVRPRRNENIERAIKRFNKKVKKYGIIEEIKERRRYIKPSEQRRKAKKRAIARRKKEEAKRKKRTI